MSIGIIHFFKLNLRTPGFLICDLWSFDLPREWLSSIRPTPYILSLRILWSCETQWCEIDRGARVRIPLIIFLFWVVVWITSLKQISSYWFLNGNNNTTSLWGIELEKWYPPSLHFTLALVDPVGERVCEMKRQRCQFSSSMIMQIRTSNNSSPTLIVNGHAVFTATTKIAGSFLQFNQFEKFAKFISRYVLDSIDIISKNDWTIRISESLPKKD